ncbi:isochorismatase family protein [Actinocorallia sp. A-T 12471]|uniref:isochorismatase family protein n=1 Tax=Actinocorallia sp. A-T 12471 TaxID=3089813 RepID=UPI0029D09E14|nr:isochorismatase family protein [Actinocorallia sp. A-T 12471]MDX6744067.1 isochorismatase family protein [Actinocorallia sp. A-T 12471]
MPDPSHGSPGDRALADDYRAAGFGGSVGLGARPALVVVDLVRAYLDPASPLYAGAEAAAERTAELADDARRLGHPVVFTYVEYQPGGADGGLFYRKVPALRLFDRGSPWGQPPPALAPRPGDLVVTKQYPSAFFGTSLASTLTALGVDSVVVTGTSTSGCVRATALDALCHGFRPVVVSDAVADRDPRPHEAALFDLSAKYADVHDTRTVHDLWKEAV